MDALATIHPAMVSLLANILTLLLCVGSAFAWRGWLVRQTEFDDRQFPLRECSPPRLPRTTLALGGMCLALLLSGFILDMLIAEPKAQPSPEGASLWQIQLGFAFDIVLTVLLAGSLIVEHEHLRQSGLYLHPLRPQLRDAWIGFLMAIGPVFLVLMLSEGAGLRGNEPEHELLRTLTEHGSAAKWFWISLTAVVAAPLAEELIFRVVLQGWLESRVPAATAIGLSSLLFCLVHNFPDAIALVPLAVILGYIQQRRRSYLTVVVIHML
ncbi:MAG: CPBP family intramembrane metalloprotease, partial [Planctomycetaceae bacterium]|nr:CPBP family intramembrane metalloprotease [Planctomycetaceae bacterium]